LESYARNSLNSEKRLGSMAVCVRMTKVVECCTRDKKASRIQCIHCLLQWEFRCDEVS